jgi:hypothetical protein
LLEREAFVVVLESRSAHVSPVVGVDASLL